MGMPSGFKKASVVEMKLEVGKSVSGKYIGSKQATFDDRKATQYQVRASDGEVYGLWANFDLDSSMAIVPVGAEVYIERLEDDAPARKGLSGAKRFSVGYMVGAAKDDIPF